MGKEWTPAWSGNKLSKRGPEQKPKIDFLMEFQLEKCDNDFGNVWEDDYGRMSFGRPFLVGDRTHVLTVLTG